MSYSSVGFIGVGAMGKEMVVNLAKKLPANVPIFINDVNKNVTKELATTYPEKIYTCDTAHDVAQTSDIIFTMLPEGRHVRLVYVDSPDGICSATIRDKIFIECSTIDTTTNLEVRAAIQKAEPTASFYDAPVSGGVLGARKATLGIFLGCNEKDPNFATLKGLLSMLGNNVIACGGPSLGLVGKLANNYLSGTIAIATSEAMNMGMLAGMNARVLAQVIHAGSGRNHIADNFNPVPRICPEAPSSNDYQGGFKVELMRKDIGLATDMAQRVGAKLALGKSCIETYQGATEDPECQGRDSRVVYRYLGGQEDWE